MFVGTDFFDAGVLWGEWILENLPDGGNVLMLSGPPGNSQGEGRGRGTGVGARADRPVHDDRRAAVLADQLGSGRDPTGPHRADRRAPADRRHRVRLRAVARRGAAGVREQRTVDPVDRHVRRQPARLLLRRAQAEQPGLRAVHDLHPERPRPPGDPVGRRPGHRRRAAGGRDLPDRAPSRTRSPASPTRSRASRTSPATSTSPPRCPARSRPHCSTRPPQVAPGRRGGSPPGTDRHKRYPTTQPRQP